MLTDLRLYQLISPSLPVGAFTYSQGLEWAIEKGWVKDEQSLALWLTSQMQDSLATLEIPILIQLHHLLGVQSYEKAQYWCDFIVASRETKELRIEERQTWGCICQVASSAGDRFVGAHFSVGQSNSSCCFCSSCGEVGDPLG